MYGKDCDAIDLVVCTFIGAMLAGFALIAIMFGVYHYVQI